MLVSCNVTLCLCLLISFSTETYFFFLSLSPIPSSPCASKLANVLEIDLDLVKVGTLLLPSETPNIMYRLKYFFSQEERGQMAGLGNVAPLSKLPLTECRGNFLYFHCGFEEILRRAFSASVCLETYSVTVKRSYNLFFFFFVNLCLEPDN